MMRGMGNMQGMMKQMQKLQKQMKEDQAKLNETVFTGVSSNELVSVQFNGAHEMTDITIKKEVIDPDDIEMLQDLVIMAVNDAMKQIDEHTQKTMGKYTRGIGF